MGWRRTESCCHWRAIRPNLGHGDTTHFRQARASGPVVEHPPDSEDTLQLTGARGKVETYPLEKVEAAFAEMMSGNAKFRGVLTM